MILNPTTRPIRFQRSNGPSTQRTNPAQGCGQQLAPLQNEYLFNENCTTLQIPKYINEMNYLVFAYNLGGFKYILTYKIVSKHKIINQELLVTGNNSYKKSSDNFSRNEK